MIKHKKALLTIIVALTGGNANDAREELSRRCREKFYSVIIGDADVPDAFIGVNCGLIATFELKFSDGGTVNTAIPDIDTITNFLENLEARTFKVSVISQDLRYYYQYIH